MLWFFAWQTPFLLIMVIIGLASRVVFTGADFDPELGLPMLAMETLGPFWVGLILASIFAATMSTADSQVLACTAAFTDDIMPDQRPQDSPTLVIGKDGVMKVMKIAGKMFVGKTPLKVSIFRRDDQKVYNMVYRDGKSGRLYAKKFKIGGVTRDKEYPLFKTHSKSRIFFFAVHDSEKKNSNILVHLDPELKRVREKVIEFDFAWLEIQGRGVKGSTLTAHKVDRVVNAPRENGDDSTEEEEQEDTKSKKPEPPMPAEKKAESSKIEPEPVAAKEPVKKAESEELDPKQGKDQVTFDFEGN